MEPTLALPGQSSTLSRIHETSAKFQRYKILLRRRWWFLLLTASIGVCVQALRITNKPQTYVSLAKLVAGGRMSMGNAGVGYQEYLNDFYGTIIETLESSEMRKHALQRVRLLFPDLREADVEVRVSQNRGSAIFNVAVVGSDQEYSQVFLNALLEEFKAFRESNREQQRNKAVQALAEDVVKADKERRDSADKLASFEKLHNVVLINQNQNEAAQMLSQFNREREALRVHLTEVEMALKDVDAAMLQKEAMASSGQMLGGNTTQKLVNDTAATDASLVQPSLGFTNRERDYLELKHQILLLTADRDELLRTLKPGHPSV
ncbi:MAG: Capsular exopolysaccharide family, partial [Verrucomicrobiaceae bacterium]|nr:Capsular exopolysaccharide family [Verrucomicrobiaceae bacterium]